MKNLEIALRLQSALRSHNFRSTIVSAGHTSELRDTIRKSIDSGLIDNRIYRQYDTYFDNMLTQDISWARSIIAVAAPRPILEVVFVIDGKKRSINIPPTYEYGIDSTITAMIESVLTPHGYRISPASLPRKLLAVRSGLARYGRNNITYIDDLGSFHRLISFYTDLPIVNDVWQEPRALDLCTDCLACTKKCPTGAIDPDRFQVHAERCLTYFTESTDPFPEWIDKSWHHCLVGCLKCQYYCPANINVRSWCERLAELTEEESALLLEEPSKDRLPPSLIEKFRNTGLLDDLSGLVRNLKGVLNSTK